MDWGGGGIAISIHCDAGEILTKTGSMAQIGICGFSIKRITEKAKNVEFQQGIDVSWVGKHPRRRQHLATRGGGPQSLFYGCDVVRTSHGLLEEPTFGNMGAEIPTYVRSDNSDASYRVDSVNTATTERRLNGF